MNTLDIFWGDSFLYVDFITLLELIKAPQTIPDQNLESLASQVQVTAVDIGTWSSYVTWTALMGE